MPQETPARFEAGTPATPSFAGLLYSLRWQRNTPLDSPQLNTLTESLVDGLVQCGARVIRILGQRTGTVAFTIPEMHVADTGFILNQSFGIVCRSGLHCAPLIHADIGTKPEGALRFSLSRFSTATEIADSIAAVARIIHAHHRHT
jgi:cysteine desulfurase / selenocysteine lyase